MVGKLFKHEFKAFSRTLIPMELILLGVALLVRLVQLFESDSKPFAIVNTSSVVMYIIAILAVLFITVFTGISRFYRNLFTHEGYLSFTLPVTPTAHILIKLAVSLIYTFITAACVILSIAIATAGELTVEIARAGGYLLHKYNLLLGTDGVFYLIEGFFLLCAMMIHGYLLWYACIAIGQRGRKNRVLLAIGVFFIIYVIKQVAGTIFIIGCEFLVMVPWFTQLLDYARENMKAFVHMALCGDIMLEMALALVYYIITRHTIAKKLNLE